MCALASMNLAVVAFLALPRHFPARVLISARPCVVVELNVHLLYKARVSSDSEMRPKLIFFVVVGLLFCSLATLETGEFLRLADDTSNDFSLLNVEANTSSAVVRQSLDSQPKAVPAPIHSRQPKVHPDISGPANTTNDLIHVLCVIRT